jgi:SecD/SecF fusion protein
MLKKNQAKFIGKCSYVYLYPHETINPQKMKRPIVFNLTIVLILSIFVLSACKKKEGFDLKMTLETSQKEMVVLLSQNSLDTTFVEAIRLADSITAVDTGDYISIFARAWEMQVPVKPMYPIFIGQLKDKVSDTTSNEEMIVVIRSEYKAAVTKTAEVLKLRLDDYDVFDYNVRVSDTVGLIMVNVEGVKDTARTMQLILMQAKLEFWETYAAKDVKDYFAKADGLLKIMFDRARNKKRNDSTAVGDSLAVDTSGSQETEYQKYSKEHPLYAKLEMGKEKDGPAVGTSKIKDTARVNYLLKLEPIAALFPRDLYLAWTVKPENEKKEILSLIAIKTPIDGVAPLTGSAVEKSYVNEREDKSVEVMIDMNDEGAEIWKNLTAANIGKSIAIMVDGYVYTYPTVMNEIPEGKSAITGNFTLEEAQDLALLLKAGMLPLNVKVIDLVVTGQPVPEEK